jgi:serine/threonine protein kinase
MTDCPTPAQLNRFLDGQLPRAERDEIESHIETCPDCQQELERQTASDAEGLPPIPCLGDREVRLAPENPGLPAVPGYEIAEELDRGGMGVVYRGRDLVLGREVAVKVLREEHGRQPGLAPRFVEEAQVGGQLNHPGIVPAHEVGQLADGRPYFTMRLVQGQTLAELLRARRGPGEDLPRFLGIFEQVCQALAYAHSKGALHRDLKPGNVMVGAFGEVQVLDWGLAKVRKGGVAGEADVWPAAAASQVPKGGVAGEADTGPAPEASADSTRIQTVRTRASG